MSYSEYPAICYRYSSHRNCDIEFVIRVEQSSFFFNLFIKYGSMFYELLTTRFMITCVGTHIILTKLLPKNGLPKLKWSRQGNTVLKFSAAGTVSHASLQCVQRASSTYRDVFPFLPATSTDLGQFFICQLFAGSEVSRLDLGIDLDP